MASTARVRMKRRVTPNAAAQALNLPEEAGEVRQLSGSKRGEGPRVAEEGA